MLPRRLRSPSALTALAAGVALACGAPLDVELARPSNEEPSPFPPGSDSDSDREGSGLVAAGTELLEPTFNRDGRESQSESEPPNPGGSIGEGRLSLDSDDASEPTSSQRGPNPTRESASAPGPFQVETLKSGLRQGPHYGTQTLHFPTDAPPPLASVVVVPGLVFPEEAIQAWGPFLASHGIATLTIGTSNLLNDQSALAVALRDGLVTLAEENTRSDSPLVGALAVDRRGVMGWSMGGGGTLMLAKEFPELAAAITLAAWSPGATFEENTVPTLLLAGGADILAGGQSQGFFESIPSSTPKMLFEVAVGLHDVANSPGNADGEVGLYGLSWLKVFLERDERYRRLLLQRPMSESDFRSNL